MSTSESFTLDNEASNMLDRSPTNIFLVKAGRAFRHWNQAPWVRWYDSVVLHGLIPRLITIT